MHRCFAALFFALALLFPLRALAQNDVASPGAYTLEDLVGTYEHFPVESPIFTGTMTLDGGRLRWAFGNGEQPGFELTPDLANNQLIPDENHHAFYIGQGPRAFTLIVEGGQIAGFRYNEIEYQKRGFVSANPGVRFVDNGDGTVTDTQGGLIWLKDASCDALIPSDHYETNFAFTRDDAMAAAAGLGDGQCGLTDGSQPGDWRLPSAAEFCGSWNENTMGLCQGGGGLLDPRFTDPPLSNAQGDAKWTEGDVFVGVIHDSFKGYHTSSPTLPGIPGAEGPSANEQVWRTFLAYGKQIRDGFPEGLVWPVRR